MGVRNYLIEGVSGVGKTSVCRELTTRGFHAINGDTELAYQGDPNTGVPLDGARHENHIWDVGRVRGLVADHQHAISFFCGGSRNFTHFIDLFDEVFVLEIDLETLERRLAERPETEWGGRLEERQLIRRLHATREDIPKTGIIVDATAPIKHVVDDILRLCDACSNSQRRVAAAPVDVQRAEAVIVGAQIVAGHDGSAELLVRLRHPNGAEGPVVLDEATGLKLMKTCGATHVDELTGQSWRRIVEGL